MLKITLSKTCFSVASYWHMSTLYPCAIYPGLYKNLPCEKDLQGGEVSEIRLEIKKA